MPDVRRTCPFARHLFRFPFPPAPLASPLGPLTLPRYITDLPPRMGCNYSNRAGTPFSVAAGPSPFTTEWIKPPLSSITV